jgi:hypothetical protein
VGVGVGETGTFETVIVSDPVPPRPLRLLGVASNSTDVGLTCMLRVLTTQVASLLLTSSQELWQKAARRRVLSAGRNLEVVQP